jgi:glycosyltransferase involved in cell wall biosynthesis
VLDRLSPIIVAPSRYVAAVLRRRHPKLAIEVIPNTLGSLYDTDAIDIDKCFERYSNRICTANDGSAISTIIVVGLKKTKANNKGADIAEAVLMSLYRKGIEVELMCVGDPLNPLPGMTVHSVPHADPVRLGELYAEADLCLVPSRYETFSQVTAEAIACGTPVVAFDLTGPNDIISHGVDGFLVKSFNVEAFADVVAFNLHYKRNNLSLLRTTAQRIRDRLSRETVAGKYEALYHRAIALRGGVAPLSPGPFS